LIVAHAVEVAFESIQVGGQEPAERSQPASEKRSFCALRFSSEGFALALRLHGTALTKSSPGYAQACGTVETPG